MTAALRRVKAHCRPCLECDGTGMAWARSYSHEDDAERIECHECEGQGLCPSVECERCGYLADPYEIQTIDGKATCLLCTLKESMVGELRARMHVRTLAKAVTRVPKGRAQEGK